MFTLPYVKTLQSKGLNIPVQVWYDGINQKIRTDVYNGLDSTVMTKDYTFAVFPRIDKVKCDIFNSTVGPTSVGEDVIPPPLPDISSWTYGGTATIKGRSCYVWRYIFKAEEKVATYSFYTDLAGAPVRLYMMGRNLLSGSHFDEYLLDVLAYGPLAADANLFQPPAHCKDVPYDPVDARLSATRLATQALSLLPSSHLPSQQQQQQKTQAASRPAGTHAVYLANSAAVHAWNAANKGATFRLGLNKFAFWTPEQYDMLRGRRRGSQLDAPVAALGAVDEVYQRTLKDDELPAAVDWRGTGADGEVKDQASCGSCWAFAAVGAMQAAWFKATGEQLSLSEQQLVDCSWNHGGNSGCNGGLYGPAIHYIIKAGGIAQEEDYQYLGANAFCKVTNSSSSAGRGHAAHGKAPALAAQFSKYVKVATRDEKALMEAVHLHGPIAVSLDASLMSFKFYTEGVYKETTCKTKEDDLDHAVLLVGYGTTEGGEAYWLIRNSWSKLWGEDGYIRISREYDCGITTSAGFAVVNATTVAARLRASSA